MCWNVESVYFKFAANLCILLSTKIEFYSIQNHFLYTCYAVFSRSLVTEIIQIAVLYRINSYAYTVLWMRCTRESAHLPRDCARIHKHTHMYIYTHTHTGLAVSHCINCNVLLYVLESVCVCTYISCHTHRHRHKSCLCRAHTVQFRTLCDRVCSPGLLAGSNFDVVDAQSCRGV